MSLWPSKAPSSPPQPPKEGSMACLLRYDKHPRSNSPTDTSERGPLLDHSWTSHVLLAVEPTHKKCLKPPSHVLSTAELKEKPLATPSSLMGQPWIVPPSPEWDRLAPCKMAKESKRMGLRRRANETQNVEVQNHVATRSQPIEKWRNETVHLGHTCKDTHDQSNASRRVPTHSKIHSSAESCTGFDVLNKKRRRIRFYVKNVLHCKWYKMFTWPIP